MQHNRVKSSTAFPSSSYYATDEDLTEKEALNKVTVALGMMLTYDTGTSLRMSDGDHLVSMTGGNKQLIISVMKDALTSKLNELNNTEVREVVPLSREQAVARIVLVATLVEDRNYRGLELASEDYVCNIEAFMQREKVSTCSFWWGSQSNSVLQDKVNKPFYRLNVKDNYKIGT